MNETNTPQAGPAYTANPGGRKLSAGWQIVGIIAELLITAAIICGLYVAWLFWWTGVQSEHEQAQTRTAATSSWTQPAESDGTTAVAKAQAGDPPVEPTSANEGELVAEVYIPRFGNQWVRNIVQGTSLEQLNKHGMGHYEESQMPGQIGNFAFAGHRAGYGSPLADINLLQKGDAVIIRTQDYWYVYRYTRHLVVLPTETEVVASNPDSPGSAPTKRMLTMTTCNPRYSTPTHRWIAYAEFAYWAKVSDGIPAELAGDGASGSVSFSSTPKQSVASQLDSLEPVVQWALIVYAVLFVAAAIVWRWPVRRAIREGRRQKPDASIYGGIARLQPGVLPVRIILLALLAVAATAALFQWVYPWAASTIPALQQMSNYVAV
ncbi:class E sortase [Bifidobacterium thermophilum]|uniref:class E sortase n=1 Tax=Bifidobacterium thermophilum TaxID=33905 RepID=UPI0030AFFBDE